MPIAQKDLPLEVEDHVQLRKDVRVPTLGSDNACLVFPKGDHAMIRKVGPYPGSFILIEIRGMLMEVKPELLKLYRRSQHSKNRV